MPQVQVQPRIFYSGRIVIVPGGRGMGNVSVAFLEVMGCMSQYHITVSVSARIGETSFVPCSILD